VTPRTKIGTFCPSSFDVTSQLIQNIFSQKKKKIFNVYMIIYIIKFKMFTLFLKY